MIKAFNIYKQLGKKQVLNNITLDIDDSKINVLFGPSGCGKTTLFRNLVLLDSPDSGKVEIFSNEFTFPTKKKYRNVPYPKINFVFQQLFLYPHLTNRANILLPFHKDNQVDIELFDFYTEFFSIESILDNYPNESSLGEKQRVAITRALILKPKFIFLDEITSALDIVQSNKIIELLKLLKDKNIGVFLITHNLEIIKQVADNLYFMEYGKIVESGKIEILSSPKSESLRKFLNL